MALPSIAVNARIQFDSKGTMGAAYIDLGVNSSTPIRCAPTGSSGLNSPNSGGSSTASVGIALTSALVDSSFPPAVGGNFAISYQGAQGIIQDTWQRTAQ